MCFVCIFVGRTRNAFLNVYLEKFWRGKRSVGCVNEIEGLGEEGEMYLYVNSVSYRVLIFVVL